MKLFLRMLSFLKSNRFARRWIWPVIAWELAAEALDLLVFLLKVRAANLIVSAKSDVAEAAYYAKWMIDNGHSPDVLGVEASVELYMVHREGVRRFSPEEKELEKFESMARKYFYS